MWMNRPGWVVHKRAFVTLGQKVTPFSLFKCGSQMHSAIRTSWTESDARDLRLRTHQPPESL